VIDRLRLTDFRNHAELQLEPGPGFAVLTGPNGAGKTNVLEAVSLLAPGRGLRAAALPDVARRDGPGGFAAAARLADGTEIGVGALAAAPERRAVRVNGAAATAASLAERLAVLWLTPATDRLFVEGAGERRRFLDRLVMALTPAHGRHAQRYEAAMRQRNRLLSDDAVPDADWLEALEARMAEHGAALHRERAEAVVALAARLADEAGPFPSAGLELDGWVGDACELARSLRAGRARDAAAGRTLIGPHRADLLVTHLEKGSPARLASTGEQKALLIGLVLAHADLVAERAGTPPVLLLDEVAAHLDPGRRAALFDRLAGRGQVWMTGTEDALFQGLGGDVTRLRLGTD